MKKPTTWESKSANDERKWKTYLLRKCKWQEKVKKKLSLEKVKVKMTRESECENDKRKWTPCHLRRWKWKWQKMNNLPFEKGNRSGIAKVVSLNAKGGRRVHYIICESCVLSFKIMRIAFVRKVYNCWNAFLDWFSVISLRVDYFDCAPDTDM